MYIENIISIARNLVQNNNFSLKLTVIQVWSFLNYLLLTNISTRTHIIMSTLKLLYNPQNAVLCIQ